MKIHPTKGNNIKNYCKAHLESDAENETSIFSFLLKVFLCDNDLIRKFMHVITKFVFFTELFETKTNYAKEMG